MTARTSSLLLILMALLALPLVAVLVRFRYVPWCPVLDLAWTELRVRDVGTLHTPLIGLIGRIGTGAMDELGSHPGPLSFYLLAPVYRLLGSSAWALQASCVVLQIVSIAAALLITRRRGGPLLVAAVGASLAVLMTGYGFNVLTEPWNPYLPVLPWLVFLLAFWSVACGDTAILPVLVLAGTFCAQTHVSYLPLTVVLGVVAFIAALLQMRLRDPPQRRCAIRSVFIAVALGVVLWVPPTIDQFIHQPGNYEVLLDYFTSSTEQTIGARLGAQLALERLDLFHLVIDQFLSPGTLVQTWPGHAATALRGMIVALVWLASLVVAWRMRERTLLRLHSVVAVTLVVGIAVLSRIFGVFWYYLMLWMWGVAVLTAIAIGWTAATAFVRLVPAARRSCTRMLSTALLVLTAAFTIRLSAAAATAVHWDTLGDVVPALVSSTARALDQRIGGARGRDGRYIVLWSDPLHGGAQGFAVLNELERLGYHVGVPPWYRSYVPHRVLEPANATATIVFANGPFIDRYMREPNGVEVAFVDPRSPEERQEYETTRAAVIAELETANVSMETIRELDTNLFAASFAPDIPAQTQQRIARLLQLGTAGAIFIFPPDF